MYSSSLNNFNYLADFIEKEKDNYLPFHFLNTRHIMRFMFRIMFIFKSRFFSNL
jgi:hypothetical protein